MDIRGLRYFTQVVRAGSFSRAAALFNVTQSALSRQLKKLEEELGVILLVRRSDGVELTRAGSVLLGEAETLMGHFGQIVDLVKGQQETFTGHITLGVPPTAGLLVTPQIFETFRSRWPYATLNVREGIASLVEEWLLDRRVDVAVLHNPSPLDGIDLIPVLNERMVVAFGAGSKDARLNRKSVRFRELGEVPLILPSLPHSNRRLIERAAVRFATPLNVALEIDSVPLTKVMIRRGFGATIITYAGVAIDVARGELVAVPIDRPPVLSTICIGTPTEARSAWLTMEMVRLVRDSIAAVVRSGEWAGARMIDDAHR